MEWIAGLDFERLANAIVILITGLAVGLGFRNGKRAPQPKTEDATVAVAGALVDGSSVRQLAEVVEHYRQDQERARKIGHELVEAVEGMTREMSEMRAEMRMQRR
ncbi:hypothetical protein [Aliihoeflea sp. PC F10.4]